jgi:predicted nucleic acid-binding protein
MNAETFSLDTNILVYALDRQAGHRHVLATRIIDQAMLGNCRLTLQSVSEFYAVATRKRLVLRIEAAAQAQDWLEMFPTVPTSVNAVRAALATAAAGQASYWDALLVATAAEAGCTAILTEDMADGSRLLGVRILNPFAGNILAPEAAALLATD